MDDDAAKSVTCGGVEVVPAAGRHVRLLGWTLGVTPALRDCIADDLTELADIGEPG